MTVHILIVTYPHEFSKVLGVFLNKPDAETQRDIEVKKDVSRGYNDFDIEEHKTPMSVTELCNVQYDWVERMGWHNKTVLEALALIASEVGEAVNECRGDEPTAEFGEELADICLRVFDLAKWQGIDLQQSIVNKIAKNELNGTRGRRI